MYNIQMYNVYTNVQVGLTKIENHHWERKEKLPISVVVSVGSGIYPSEKLGSVNAQQCLYFGAHWLRLKDTLDEIRNLAELLTNAVSCAALCFL